MPSSERLSEFVAIIDAGSISGAARALGIPRASLSRRLSALEVELGISLVHRQTRRLVLTPAGEELERSARRIVREAAEAWEAVRRLDDVPRGLLRVSDNGAWMNPLFVRFLQEYPGVKLEVLVTTRHVDLVAEGIDVAIRFGTVRDDKLIARRVWQGSRIVVASPDYLLCRGSPTHPKELRGHECMVWYSECGGVFRRWPLLDGGTVEVGGRLTANSLSLLHTAALEGVGLVMLPVALVARDLAEGRLMSVLEDAVGADASASLVYVERRFLLPKVRAFIDLAVPYLRSRLDDVADPEGLAIAEL